MKKLLIGAFCCICLATVQLGAKPVIIPQPDKVINGSGVFRIQEKIEVAYEDEKLSELADVVALNLEKLCGVKSSAVKAADLGGSVKLVLDASLESNTGAEGYVLKVSKEGVNISASAKAGIFYGTQTLNQLILNSQTSGSGGIGCVKIVDKPQFQWRGFMLDSCRHFQPKKEILRYLDLMAFYKMNKFHWHLTEDEAWRLQIDAYPKLTEIGAFPGVDGQEVNGFYTKEDVKEIIAYAKARYIEVIPEIDMPGHATAALFCYPEFSCKEGPFEKGKSGMNALRENSGRLAFCAGNDQTIAFLKTIIDEVYDLFESPLIHIGGDERPKDNWNLCEKCKAKQAALGLDSEDKLQNWFMAEMNSYILAKGKTSICWAENMKDGIPEKQIVQAWHPGEALYAAKAGHKVVNSDNGYTYLDYPATFAQKSEFPDWMPVMTLRKCYNFNPVPFGLSRKYRKNIIGVEAPIWTEGVKLERLDYMVFPRLIATAEVGWTKPVKKSFSKFVKRLKVHASVMEKLEIDFDKSSF